MSSANAADAGPSEVASPCVGICRVDGADVCVGCGRSIDEIRGWIRSGTRERREVLQRARERLAARAARGP